MFKFQHMVIDKRHDIPVKRKKKKNEEKSQEALTSFSFLAVKKSLKGVIISTTV